MELILSFTTVRYGLLVSLIERSELTLVTCYEGLELAKIAKLPTPVIDKAHLVAATLDTLAETSKVSSKAYKVQRRKQELLSVRFL